MEKASPIAHFFAPGEGGSTPFYSVFWLSFGQQMIPPCLGIVNSARQEDRRGDLKTDSLSLAPDAVWHLCFCDALGR